MTALHVVSVWTGDKYGPEYPAILHDMVARNLSLKEHRHWCITDRPDELPEGVTAISPTFDTKGWWAKTTAFSHEMPWAIGDRVMYFDLDVAITGRLEDLADTKGIIQDWNWPCFNSSVMVWDHGEHGQIWRTWNASFAERPGALIPADLLPKGQPNGGDQEWITQVAPDFPILPAAWCRSWHDCTDWPPAECKVVVFHGAQKPHLNTDTWVGDVWKVGGLTSLPEMKGVNVTYETITANIIANRDRDVPWFTGFEPNDRTCVIVCGGPSMKDDVEAIRAHKQRGAQIVSVNNALRFLLERRIKPHCHCVVDARPENVSFLKGAPKGIRYLIASQCDPSLFDHLKDHEVLMWHNAVGDGTELEELLKGIDKPLVAVPGGCTVGLRAIWLAIGSGFRKIHIYGMDSSYHDGAHHAYEQSLNDGEVLIDVVLNGKHYVCAKWMARQANDFQDTWKQAHNMGARLFVHGRGLIPDMARALEKQREAA